MGHANKITYIANAGVLIECNDKKIIIDGLCNSKLPQFKTTPDSIRTQIINNQEPFNAIDIMLFTHNHSDHFDKKSTLEYINSDGNRLVVSTQEIIAGLRKNTDNINVSRLIEINPKLNCKESIKIKGINIQGISTLHEGEEYKSTQNITYLIEVNGKKILHVGDAKPIKENYINHDLVSENIDVLIAPFPYVGVPSARQVVEKYIKPSKIVIIHFPYREFDNYGWIDATKRSLARVQNSFIETVLFEDIGSSTLF